MQFKKTLKWLAGSALLTSLPVSALEVDTSAYMSLVFGSVVNGDGSEFFESELERDCPCFIGNYTQVGIYEDDGIDYLPDSAFGFNTRFQFTDEFSLSAQVEAVGGNEFEPTLTWLYARYDITSELSIDIGKKGLPLYFYSDFINVGYAYPWIRPSGDVYGWPISTYDGVSLNYITDLDHGSLSVNVWYGEEEDENNREYNDIYYVSESYYMEWTDITGIAIEYEYDWLTFRVVKMSSETTEIADYGPMYGVEVVADGDKQDFTGFALNVDYEDYLLFFEYNEFDVDRFISEGYYLSLGKRTDDVTTLVSFSRYADEDPDFGSQINNSYVLTVRWDYAPGSAIKFQYDYLDDRTQWPYYTDEAFTGDVGIFAVGVEHVF